MARVAPHGFVRHHGVEIAAIVIYGATAFLYLGLRLFLDSGPHYVGFGVDPQIFIWAFAWWPHALLQGQNPFVTDAIWAPHGVNLTWATAVPGLALVFTPVTLLLGPVTSYDIAAILLPCLAAWTAFLLCRHVTRSTFPSLIGGYLFGFSSYVLGQEEGHPHMSAVFLLPLVGLVALRYLEGALSGRAFTFRLGPILAFQLLISTEVSLTLALAFAGAIVIGYASSRSHRRRLFRLLGPLAASYLLAGILTGPFVYYLVSGTKPAQFPQSSGFVTDLLNFVVPTKLALASYDWASGIALNFPGDPAEQGAYLGLPVVVILVLIARRRPWSEATTFLFGALGLTILATIGNQLTVDGNAVATMPWSFVAELPILRDVLPERLIVYVWLIVAVAVARWTADRPPGVARRLLPSLAALALLPNPDARVWATSFSVPRFFTDAAYRSCLTANETVLPLPVSSGGSSMLWQTYDDFRFRLAGGYVAPTPPKAFLHPRAVAHVAEGEPVPAAAAQALELYIKSEHVTAVVVDPRDQTAWSGALALIARPQRAGGVVIYRVSASSPECRPPNRRD